MEAVPILYSFRRCPYAMRARMALWVSGVVCELREIALRAKPAEMLAASPKGTVPVLVLPNAAVIEESIDIMRWALACNDQQRWLAGDDAALIARNDGAFKRDLDRYKYPEKFGSDALKHRGAGLEFLRELDLRLAGRAYLCGASMGLADAALLPFVRQFADVDRGWFDALDLPHVQRWLGGFLASDLFAAVMLRRAPWQAGDEVVLFGASHSGVE